MRRSCCRPVCNCRGRRSGALALCAKDVEIVKDVHCRDAALGVLRCRWRDERPVRGHPTGQATVTRQANCSSPIRSSSPPGMKGSAAGAFVDVELLKAVAQAWHAQSGNPRPSRASAAAADGDAGAGARSRPGAAPRRPSRFKLEAMAAAEADARARARSWDFAQSLWDPYELVAVARKLESGLAIADNATAATQEGGAQGPAKRGRESGRSLRNLLRRSTSRKFQEPSS